MGRDVSLRALLCDPRQHSIEMRSREFISPVLIAAVAIAGGGDVEL
jgi:hypothetical protein